MFRSARGGFALRVLRTLAVVVVVGVAGRVPPTASRFSVVSFMVCFGFGLGSNYSPRTLIFSTFRAEFNSATVSASSFSPRIHAASLMAACKFSGMRMDLVFTFMAQ